MIEALAEVLSRRILPIDFTLDFMWLLFTKSASAINIDGFVSLPFTICELQAYALAAQAVFHTIPCVSDLTRRYASCSFHPRLWELADDTANRKSRARVLLRLLAVNSAPMEQIVKNQFHEGDR